MGQRKNLRKELDDLGQLLEWGEDARQDKDRQQKEDGKLDRLGLRPGKGGDEEAQPERTEQKEETNQDERERLIELHVKMKAGYERNYHDEHDRDSEVGQNFPDHNFAALERSNQQLVKRPGFAFACNGAGHERDREQL